MEKHYGLFVFFVSFTLNLAGNATGVLWLANVAKPAIVAGLLMLVYAHRQQLNFYCTRWLTAALSLSLIGDILLIFEPHHPLFFMSGLGAFLLAQVCYIILFAGLKKSKEIPWHLLWIVASAAYYFLLMQHLLPLLGPLKIPVIVYGLVICGMALVALHFLHPKANRLQLCAAGAVMFATSDSLLALNKFDAPFTAAGVWIMLTYGLAQLLIVWGVLKNAAQQVQ